MAISYKDLLLAILSMDSYNRGYNAGIEGLSKSSGTKVGSATIRKNAEDNLDAGAAVSAGFYAVTYDTQYGKVISYRGTDNPISLGNLNPWSDTPGGDIWNGWGAGGGAPHTVQARLAADF